jgi:hypothetical protein
VTTLLIISIPVCIIATGFLILFSVRMGLKWQYDLKHDISPTEVKGPIKAVTEAVQHSKDEAIKEYTKQMIQEWSPFQEEVKVK